MSYFPDNQDLEKRGGSIAWKFLIFDPKMDSLAKTNDRTQCLFFSSSNKRLVVVHNKQLIIDIVHSY